MARALSNRALLRARWCLPVGAALSFAGCQGGGDSAGGAQDAPVTVIERLAARTESEPIGKGLDAGIELHWWLVDDSDEAVARAMAGVSSWGLGGAPDELPVEFDREAAEAWRSSGLRVYSLAPGSFASLQRRLPPRSAWERVWVGQPVEWRELVAGALLRRGALVRADGLTVPVPPGRLRLLVRSWLTPDEDGAAMHVELLPQIAQRNPALTLDPRREVERLTELDAGRVFETLRLEGRLVPGRVYLIVPAAPDEDWAAVVRAADRRRAEGAQEDWTLGTGRPEGALPGVDRTGYEVPEGPIGPFPDLTDPAYGPEDRGPVSLGEAAFFAFADGGAEGQDAGRRRMIIVILARSPGRFGLLP